VWGGDPIEACVKALDGVPQVVAVGVNCGAPHAVETLVRRVASATDKAIVAYPNGTEGFDRRTQSWAPTIPPEAFTQLAARWLAAGARVLGGCCRTGPEHIAALAKWRASLRDPSTTSTSIAAADP
jgi:homocysteine S-methyltransferase